jgi:hypothetical protein
MYQMTLAQSLSDMVDRIVWNYIGLDHIWIYLISRSSATLPSAINYCP